MPFSRPDVIRRAMQVKKMTNKELVKQTEIGAATISNICTGKQPVGIKKLESVCEVLGVPLSAATAEAAGWSYDSQLVGNDTEYYSAFKQQIRSAQKRIHMVGGGLSFDGNLRQRAHEFLRLFFERSQYVQITRIEASHGADRAPWIKHVAMFLTGLSGTSMQDGLRLYAPKHHGACSLLDCCVTDDDLPVNTINFMMPRVDGTQPGFAFLGSDPRAASIVSNRIEAMTKNTALLQRIRTAEDLLNLHGLDPTDVLPSQIPNTKLFVYGTDLLREQLCQRCPNAELVGFARCEGVRPSFSRSRATPDQVSAPTLESVADQNSHVIGCLYRVSQLDLARLDFYLCADNRYEFRRQQVEVKYWNGDSGKRERVERKAKVYVVNQPEPAIGPPSDEFYERLNQCFASPLIQLQLKRFPPNYEDYWYDNRANWEAAYRRTLSNGE